MVWLISFYASQTFRTAVTLISLLTYYANKLACPPGAVIYLKRRTIMKEHKVNPFSTDYLKLPNYMGQGCHLFKLLTLLARRSAGVANLR